MELLFLDKTTVQVLAAECLGKGYRLWKNHVANHQRIILKLFSLTLLESERKQRYIRGALTQIGAEVPLEFVMALGNPRASKFNPREHSAALAIIAHLVQKCAPALLPELATLVEAVLRSLDPKSHSRDSCLSAATDILKLLIAKYPMIDHDHDSQARLRCPPRERHLKRDLRVENRERERAKKGKRNHRERERAESVCV